MSINEIEELVAKINEITEYNVIARIDQGPSVLVTYTIDDEPRARYCYMLSTQLLDHVNIDPLIIIVDWLNSKYEQWFEQYKKK